MKPFCLEAAKRGEKVQCSADGEWKDVHFVGVSADGMPVIQRSGGIRCILLAPTDALRMAPKPPKEMWVQLYVAKDVYAVACTNAHESLDAAKKHAANLVLCGCKPIGEPQKVLVPDES